MKRMCSRSVLVGGLAITVALVDVSQVSAQELEEVIVTAQMREQNLHKVPVSVTSVGGERIENSEISNVEELANLVPSLRFTSDQHNNQAVNIRGIGTNVYSVAVEPNVAVMLDNVVLARTSLANFEFADIERIEVLRGPQGTLFGKNASAGLVHVITRDPVPEFEAKARVNYEMPQNFPGDQLITQATVNVPIAGYSALRINAFSKTINGHLIDVEQGGKKIPDSEEWGVRGKWRWEPTDALTFQLNTETYRGDGETGLLTYRDGHPTFKERSGPIEFGEDNRQGKSTGGNESDKEGAAASLKVDWNLGAFTLTSITGYRDATNFDNITIADLDGKRGQLVRNASEIDIETLTQELRITSGSGGALEYTVGALLFDNRVSEDFGNRIEDISAAFIARSSGFDFIPIGIGDDLGGTDAVNLSQTRDVTVDTRNLGIFAQGTWHFLEKWDLTVGARYIDEEVDAVLARTQRIWHHTTGQEISSTQFPATRGTVADTTATGKVALMYEWRPTINFYGSVSTGYRGAAFDVARPEAQEALDNPVKPEKATSYELGVKSRLFDNRLEVTTTAFLTYFEDFQAQLRDLDAEGSVVEHRLDNAGELETRGVELEFRAMPTASLSLIGSLLYNRAVYNEFVTQCFQGQRPGEDGGMDTDGDGACDANDVSGGVLANAPELSAAITARYEHGFLSGHMLYGQIDGRWQDEVQFTNEQQPTTIEDAYSVWNFRAGWLGAGGRWEVAGYVKNLLAQNYAVNLTPVSFYNDRRGVVHKLPVGADRLFGLSLEYRW